MASYGYDPSLDDEDETESSPAGSTVQQVATELQSGSPASKKILGQMNDLVNQKAAVPEETRKSLRDALAYTNEMYNQKTTRNDWLEVAQSLAQAVAQFGAAKAGGSKHDMSGVTGGPGIDYQARNRRLGEERLADIRQQQDAADLYEKQRDRELSARLHPLDLEYREEVANASQQERNKERAEDRKTRERMHRETLANQLRVAGMKHGSKPDSTWKMDFTNTGKEIQALDRQAATLQKQLDKRRDAETKVINDLATMDEVTAKSEEKLREKLGKPAADAGIDLKEFMRVRQEESKRGEGEWGLKPIEIAGVTLQRPARTGTLTAPEIAANIRARAAEYTALPPEARDLQERLDNLKEQMAEKRAYNQDLLRMHGAGTKAAAPAPTESPKHPEVPNTQKSSGSPESLPPKDLDQRRKQANDKTDAEYIEIQRAANPKAWEGMPDEAILRFGDKAGRQRNPGK